VPISRRDSWLFVHLKSLWKKPLIRVCCSSPALILLNHRPKEGNEPLNLTRFSSSRRRDAGFGLWALGFGLSFRVLRGTSPESHPPGGMCPLQWRFPPHAPARSPAAEEPRQGGGIWDEFRAQGWRYDDLPGHAVQLEGKMRGVMNLAQTPEGWRRLK